MDVFLKEKSPQSVDVIDLTTELFYDLKRLYGNGNKKSFLEENKQMIKFAVAYLPNKIPIACGAIKHFNSEIIELKRMFVKKNYRGKGISKLILGELEKFSSESGYKKIILETGIKQPEAISLYRKQSYNEIKCFGHYAREPESICFEKFIV